MSQNSCCNCGYIGKLENHHVVPKVMGGTFTVPLCVKCHGLVHGRDFVKSRNLQSIGIEKAKLAGKYKDRRPIKTAETFENWIKKKAVKEICVYMTTTNYSYRDIATAVGCSMGTVQKAYKLISQEVASAISKDQLKDVNLICANELKIKRLEKKLLSLKNK
jgi:hypothetical protein